MTLVKTTYEDGISIMRMANGVTNPISPDLVREMSESLVEVKAQSRGMLLCGGSKFFSIGLDLPQLLRLDRSGMADFYKRINDLALDLFTVPIPTICVLSGHAVAGGCVLALTGDYRFASVENKKIGLSEIQLGVPVPYLADMLLRHTVGERIATHLLFSGAFMPFLRAKDIGLIDDVCPADKLETYAMEKISILAHHHQQAFSAMKAVKVEHIKRRYEENREETHRAFLDCWFSDSAQQSLKEASRKF